MSKGPFELAWIDFVPQVGNDTSGGIDGALLKEMADVVRDVLPWREVIMISVSLVAALLGVVGVIVMCVHMDRRRRDRESYLRKEEHL